MTATRRNVAATKAKALQRYREEEVTIATDRAVQAAFAHHTLLWWALLSSISVVNVAIWLYSYRSLMMASGEDGHNHQRLHRHPYQQHHLLLSGIYVFVCAYRSFLPRIDLERYCLWDTFASSIALGRIAATVAELAFACQIALFLHSLGTAHDHDAARLLALALVPMIAAAQCFCWWGVVSLNHLFHAIEESIWAAGSASVGSVFVSLAVARPGNPSLHWVCVGGAIASFAFCGFMVTVDVPMYLTRWREGQRRLTKKEDDKRKSIYMDVYEGGSDALRRRVVTKSWEVWKEETVWLTGYFSSAVWLSLAMVHYPAPV